eukprot:TRINITY_DN33119_c0_g1_i1.p1 TRINITY_DN33119_c0_g1~~TRINITY_DN33119_c0_g1_i1.p1  ORF type:complete len:896 (+),score=141.17 TRINITY_DN33119_c0_g1_i1:60-2747(+)
MVNFGKDLEHSVVPEWKPYYCSYNRLKGWINEMEQNLAEEGASKYRAASQNFFEELKVNLSRVDSFYNAQEKKAREKIERLCRNSSLSEENLGENVELQALLENLQAFAESNSEGFRKITKKFDKMIGPAFQQPKADTSWWSGWSNAEDDGLPQLQDVMLTKLDTYAFRDAANRLAPLEETLQAFHSGSSVKLQDDLKKSLLTQATRRMSRAGSLDLSAWTESSPLTSQSPGTLLQIFRLIRGNLDFIIMSVVVAYLSQSDVSPSLTLQSWFVIWVVFSALLFLLRGWEADAVMMSANLLLNVSGILTLQEAWSAFSNDVVLAVAALGGISSALGRTGVIDSAFGPFLGSPKSYSVALFRVALPTILFNVGISNTCVMSCLMPVVQKWSAENGFHQAVFLLPISYLLLISGALAMFSTSTNLVCQGQLTASGLEPFSQFALALPGLACSLASLLYMMVAVPFFLGRFWADDEAQESIEDVKRRAEKTFDIRLQVLGQAMVDKTLRNSGFLNMLSGGMRDVISIERYGDMVSSICENTKLKLDDIVHINTSIDSIVKLTEFSGLQYLTFDQSDLYGTLANQRELVQVVLSAGSPLIKNFMQSARERASYSGSIIAYRPIDASRETTESSQGKKLWMQSMTHSMDKSAKVSFPQRALRQGDSIIFDAPVSFYRNFRESTDFVMISRVTRAEGQGRLRDLLPWYAGPASAGILLAMILAVAFSVVPLFEGVLLALTALIITKCTTLEEVVKAVKLRTVMVIVGAFGLGKAIGKEGVAAVLAQLLLFLLGPLGEIGYLSAIFMSTVALGIVFHGTAVVILMFPVCLQVAGQTGLPVHQVLAVLCIAATCQLLSPISYQTNLMAFTAGGYDFADFTKVGVGLVLIVGVIGIPLCQYCFPA